MVAAADHSGWIEKWCLTKVASQVGGGGPHGAGEGGEFSDRRQAAEPFPGTSGMIKV